MTEIPRDQYGRPKIKQPNGKDIGYTRISGLAKELDSGKGLEMWKTAMTAIGMTIDRGIWDQVRDLVDDSILSPWEEHKSQLIALAEKAMEVAGSTVKRDLGTELHHWAEVYDRTLDMDIIPADMRDDLDAYVWGTAEVEMLETELFVVVDEIQAAGTLDRLSAWRDRIVLADIKSGQREHEYPMAVEMQCAMYARGQRYDLETGERSPLHPDIDLSGGLMIHLPSGQAKCDLYELDLDRGWRNVQRALDLREARKIGRRKMKPVK